MARAQQQPVSSHYLSQAGLAVLLTRAVAAAWPSLDPSRTGATLPGFTSQIAALVNRFSLTSSTLAAREYRRQRIEAGIRSSFTVPQASPPTAEKIDRSLSWATRQLRDGTLDGLTGADLSKQLDTIKVTVEGVSQKLVLDSGRMTTVDAVQADRQARAWAREARAGCCSFCAMLATRGAIYKSEHTAGRSANERFVGEGEFKYHDHCHCVAVPVFGVYEKSAHARQWTADWDALKQELGYTPSLNQWRQHIEGRPITDLAEPAKPAT